MRKNATNPGYILIAGMFILFLLLMAFGCNPARKIEKAEQLVITTPKSFEKVGKKYWDLYYQPTDTTPKYIKGDSVPYPVITIDSFATYLAVRELQDSMTTSCKTAVDKAYKLGAEHAWKELNGKVRVDTIIITDRKCPTILKMVDDSLTRANYRLERTEADLISATATGQQYRKDGQKLLYWVIGLSIALGVSNAFWIINKFRKI